VHAATAEEIYSGRTDAAFIRATAARAIPCRYNMLALQLLLEELDSIWS